MLHLNDIALRVGGRLLLEGATVHVPAGHRVGLVGRNGTGKTTLLRLIRGELQPDAGRVRLRANARVDGVAQEAPGGNVSPLEMVLAADRERAALMAEAETVTDPYRIGDVQNRLAEIGAHAAPARAATILKGLGFDEEAQARPLASFSGGWRMRVALAGVLFAEPDLLLLDEPTNHLDLEASLWLEDWLRRYPRTLILVSHDRDLLNGVPSHILHLEGRKLSLYTGDYDTFERTRREKIEQLEKARARQDARKKHMQAFVDHFRYKATKARQAQSRLKAIERMADLPAPPDEPEVVFRFPKADVPAPPLIRIENVRAGYGDHVVLDRLDLRLDPDDRIALLGANGNGKSTFAKLLAGRLQPLQGEVTRAPKLRVGFFAQHQLEELRPDENGIQHLGRTRPELREEQLRQRLGAVGLSQDKAERPSSALSGGEKARLNFALICAVDPQILILDEPTNHLDIDSREALVEAINDFAGAVVLISHDRHLIELTADRLWLVAERRVRPFDDDLDAYRRLLLQGSTEDRGEKREREKAERKVAQEKKKAEVVLLRRVARDAEKQMERLADEHDRLRQKLADETTYELPGSELQSLVRREAELSTELAAAEARWLAAEEALQSASSNA